jgi:hypothetical protein
MGYLRFIQRPGAAKVALGLLILRPLLLASFPQTPSERTPMESWDDRLLRVEKSAPGFGGMFTGEDGQLVVYLLDPTTLTTARAAIESVFGPSSVPKAGIRAVRGQYTISQLKRWSERGNKLLEMPGVVIVDLDEGRNRVMIGLEDETRMPSVVKRLRSLRIPREAVILEVKGRILQLEPGSF